MRMKKDIYSIGHSTHPIDEFLEILKSFAITLLVDIRRHPGSRKYPQYNQDNLLNVLKNHQIEYLHLGELGGRRRPNKDSRNTGWRNLSFRGYADYMESEEFIDGIQKLENLAIEQKTAFMCSEAVWWSCHRSMVADYLKLEGWTVWHIMGVQKSVEHPYTSVSKIIDGKLNYEDINLFNS